LSGVAGEKYFRVPMGWLHHAGSRQERARFHSGARSGPATGEDRFQPDLRQQADRNRAEEISLAGVAVIPAPNASRPASPARNFVLGLGGKRGLGLPQQ